jgi:hypothetical protein
MTTDTVVPKQLWQTIHPLLPHHHAAAAADLASTTARRWPGSSTSSRPASPGEGDRLTGPQQVQRRQALVKPRGEQPGICGLTETAELIADRRAETRPQDHPSPAEPVKGRYLFGEL